MKSLRVVMLAIISVLAGVMVNAQTADEIINKHIEAIGGKNILNAVKTVYTEYDMDVQGNTASGITYQVNGKGYRNEIDFGGQKIIQVYTEKGGWGINPMMGQTSAEAMPEDQAKAGKAQLFVGGPLLDYAAKGHAVELQGNENVGSVSAHKLKVVTKEGNEIIYFIDPTSYYILKTVNKATVNGQAIETIAAFSNYTKTDFGYVNASNVELTLPQGFTLNITTKKIEVNKDIDMKLFDM